jgi:hypothetical protein
MPANWQVATIALVSVAMFAVAPAMVHAQTKPERDCSLQLVKGGIPSTLTEERLRASRYLTSCEERGSAESRSPETLRLLDRFDTTKGGPRTARSLCCTPQEA